MTPTICNLFQLHDFTLHSGAKTSWKIECDALTDADWEALAFMAMEKMGWPQIRMVVGVPFGGAKLAQSLQRNVTDEGCLLVVDDVLTTGASMEKLHKNAADKGLVVFARGECPSWITPIFQM